MNVIMEKLREIFKSTQKSELEGVFSANNNRVDSCTYEKFRFVYLVYYAKNRFYLLIKHFFW